MVAVALVLLAGAGVGALGLVVPDLYVVGILILSAGVIGAVVLAWQPSVRRLRRIFPAAPPR